MTGWARPSALEEGGHGIRVTAICPGEVDTPILEGRPKPPARSIARKILQPADIAAAVLFVACLPTRAHVPELVIKPTWQEFA